MRTMIRAGVTAAAAGGLLLASMGVWAQPPGGRRQNQTAEAAAPFDATGYWVSMITHDWLLRMVVPQRGQYTDVPITQEAKDFADAWRPGPVETAGQQCEAYGAAVIMQLPTQLHITWQDANTLKVETDAGMQTRLLYFRPDPAMASAPASLQGYSQARWMLQPGGGRGGGGPRAIAPPGAQADVQAPQPPPRAPTYGWLQVATNNMLAGLLRKNGVPYSANARMMENWAVNEAYGDQYLTVTTILTDPQYLQMPYTQNAIFKRESDGSRWAPAPCSLEH